MPKYPCDFIPSCFDQCMSKGYFLQQIHGHGYQDKHCCPYTIYTDGHCEYPHPGDIRHLEVCGEAECTVLHGCRANEIQVRVRIPLLLNLCTCACDSTAYAFIEDTVPIRFYGCTDELWKCRPLANACVRMCRNNACCKEHSSPSLDVHIQVYLLCGCVMHPARSSCPCPETKPWYPQPFSGHRK